MSFLQFDLGHRQRGEIVEVTLTNGANITKQEVIDFSPSLADKVARSTATHTVQEIAEEIAELLKDA